MARYIDENEVYKLVGDTGIAKIHCVQIDDLPRADVADVKHGKWVKSDYPKMLVCSVCRDAYVEDDWLKSNKWHYCPHCGAKMDGKESKA